MSSSADGILAYGFDLGGGDEWLVREAGEYGELELDWYNEAAGEDEEDDDDLPDFAPAAIARLLTASGFTEADCEAEGYHLRRNAAEKALGVEIVAHGYEDPQQYLIAASVLIASQGEVEDAGAFVAAADEATRQEWDGKLLAALATLGLTPKQEQPKWLLCSDYG